MNRWKFRRNTSRLILVLASLVTLIIIVITGASVYASTPDAAIIAKIEGTGLKIGERTSRDRTPASKNQQLRGNKVLYVPGNGSLAYLGFIVDAPLDTTGLLVSAGPSQSPSEWSFPCTAKGGFTIAWKDGSDRGCEAGIKVQSSSKKSGLPNNNLQASRRLLAQAEDEVTVVPTPGQSTIQTADTFTGISVKVLVGNVQVKSARNPGGRLVKAGERYNYPQDTITPIDINSILNSPEMQDFLNPDNWSSPNIPQRVADGFSEQLGEIRTALGKGSPAIASNSGNNNNSGQTPLNQSPQRTVPQSTPPQPQAENPSYSYSDRGGYCTVVLRGDSRYTTVEFGLVSLEDPCEVSSYRSICSSLRGYTCEFIRSTYLLHGQNQVLLSCEEGFSQTFVGIGDEPIKQAQLAEQTYRVNNVITPYQGCIHRVIESSPQPPQPITP
jgi:hypothetical protein